MRIRHLVIAAVLAVTCPTNTAQAEDLPEWIEIGTTTQGTVIYARTADIAVGRPGTTSARLWIKFDASKDRTMSWRTTVVLYNVNCVTETYRIVQGTSYYPDGTNTEMRGMDQSTKYVTPDSNMEVAVKLLCAAPGAPTTDYR